jgi:hypothetical protein
MTRASAKQLWDALDRFEEKYGGSEFARSVADKMGAVRRKIGPLLPVPRFNWRRKLLLMKTGKEKFAQKGLRFWRARMKPTRFEDEGVRLEPGFLWGVSAVDGDRCENDDMRDLAAAVRKYRLAALDVGGDPSKRVQGTFDDDAMAHLKDLIPLQHLDLQNAPITDAWLAHLSGLRNLRSLNLYAVRAITDEGVAHLAGLTNLEWLKLETCSKLTGEGLRHLAGMKKLKWLARAFNGNYTDAGLAHLHGLKSLGYIKLQHCPEITDEGVRALNAAIPGLEVAR